MTKRMFGKEPYDDAAAALGRALANRWREYIADERAAQNAAGGGAGSAGGGGAKQHRRITGEASYTLTLRITNWTIIANDLVRRRASGWEPYARLQQVPVYDLASDLRFLWQDRNVRARDVDKDGYTSDWAQHGASGPRRPVPDDTIGIPQASSRPWPEPDSGPGVVDWLFGERGQQARQAAENMRDRVQDARQGAEDWLRDRLARDREALGLGGSGGPQSSAGPGAGPAHTVSLGMRWHRRDGLIRANYLDDIIMDVVEGRPSRLNYVVSATLPNGAFDIREPPNWTSPNPKPSPPPARPGGSWLRP